MANQAFLDGLRAHAGMGQGDFTRPASTRSADQNMANSGNPGYVNNMTPTTAPPTYVAPRLNQQQQASNSQAYQGSMQQQQAQQMALMRQQQMQQQQQPFAALFGPQYGQGGGNYAGAAGAMPNVNFTAPQPTPGQVQTQLMGNGGQPATGQGVVPPNGYTPRNLAAGPSGYNYVRPMVR